MTRAKSKSKTRRGGPKSQSRRGDRGGPRYKAIGWVREFGTRRHFYGEVHPYKSTADSDAGHTTRRVYIRVPAKRGRGRG